MMRSSLLTGLILWSFGAFSPALAAAYDPQLFDLLFEKRVVGELMPGNRAVINPATYQQMGYQSGPTGAQRVTVRTSVPNQPVQLYKSYQIVSQPGTFDSLISVTDQRTGKEIRRISVGRRAVQLLSSPETQRVYVLCGGYFSSVWEIDTVRDTVVRKLPRATSEQALPPLWNPSDLALMPQGQTLALASGTLQLVDLRSGIVSKELPLPPQALKIKRLMPLSADTLGVAIEMSNGATEFYKYEQGSETLKPGRSFSAAFTPRTQAQVQVPRPNQPPAKKLGYVASRNADFIHVLDLDGMRPLGIIPVDFPVDSLQIAPDRKRLFAYHQRYGQISVIDLTPGTRDFFAVSHRLIDDRFKGTSEQPLKLAADVSQVYLWDGYSQILAGIDPESLYLRINTPLRARLNAQSERIWLSHAARKRFYLRNGQLMREYAQTNAPSNVPERLQVGGQLVASALSPDHRNLYVLDASAHQVIQVDTQTEAVVLRTPVSEHADGLMLSTDGNSAFVLDTAEGSVSQIDLRRGQVSKLLPLDIGLYQPYVVTLFDPRLTQLVRIELPRYQRDVAQIVG
jgi:DNA-binding beta-propeller fold protein YncE